MHRSYLSTHLILCTLALLCPADLIRTAEQCTEQDSQAAMIAYLGMLGLDEEFGGVCDNLDGDGGSATGGDNSTGDDEDDSPAGGTSNNSTDVCSPSAPGPKGLCMVSCVSCYCLPV